MIFTLNISSDDVERSTVSFPYLDYPGFFLPQSHIENTLAFFAVTLFIKRNQIFDLKQGSTCTRNVTLCSVICSMNIFLSFIFSAFTCSSSQQTEGLQSQHALKSINYALQSMQFWSKENHKNLQCITGSEHVTL